MGRGAMGDFVPNHKLFAVTKHTCVASNLKGTTPRNATRMQERYTHSTTPTWTSATKAPPDFPGAPAPTCCSMRFRQRRLLTVLRRGRCRIYRQPSAIIRRPGARAHDELNGARHVGVLRLHAEIPRKACHPSAHRRCSLLPAPNLTQDAPSHNPPRHDGTCASFDTGSNGHFDWCIRTLHNYRYTLPHQRQYTRRTRRTYL
jgi:hypothetical protein